MKSFHRFLPACAILAVALFAFLPDAGRAAQLTGMGDTVSSYQPSAGSDHTIAFTTPTGVDASTDTITLDFASFSLTGVGVGDVDVFHGPTTGVETSETLASSAAAGTWGVSFSGTTVTFTPPTDAAAGEIAANDRVIIEIGTNASGGTNQITNPSSAGDYELVADGDFGDDGRMGLAIGDNTVVVDATVPATSTTGGGAGGGGIQPPFIFNVQATTTSFTSIRVTWQTDEVATSFVDYGHQIGYASGTVSDLTFTGSHSVDVIGLSPCVTYHFRVRSADVDGNTSASGDYLIVMPCDSLAPVISNVRAVNVTDTSADILWNTNEPATSVVEYGLTPAYGSTGTSPGFVTGHVIPLAGLQPGTVYHFRVISLDPSGNRAMSGDFTFTTQLDATPPANGILTAVPGDQSVQLYWTRPSDSDYAGVRIVRKMSGFPTGITDGIVIVDGTGTTFLDTGLMNGVTYYYAAHAYDTDGNFASGALASATPFGEGDQPAPPGPPTPPTMPPGVPLPPGVIPAGPGVTTTPPTPGTTILLQIFGANGTLPLAQGSDGTIGTVVNGHLMARIPADSMNGIPQIIAVSVGGHLFNLTYDPRLNAYTGVFTAPSVPGYYELRAQAIFTDGRVAQTGIILKIQELGRVFERPLIGAPTISVPDATVRLLLPDPAVGGAGWTLWNGTAYGVSNPVRTDADGRYVFEVPPGWYRVEVRKHGYETFVSAPVFTDGNIFNLTVELIRLPRAPEEIGGSTAQLQSWIEWIGYWIRKFWEFLSSGPVRDAINDLLGWLLAISLLVAASGIPFFDARMFAQLLLAAMIPLLLLRRRQNGPGGTVYDATTKRPVELALVRLVHAPTGLQIRTAVTDAVGHYAFKIAKAGTYLIKVVKPGYLFPSHILDRVEKDGVFDGLYYGSRTKLPTGWWAPPIPMDPDIPAEQPAQARVRQALRRMQYLTLLIAAVLAPILFLAAPSWFSAAIVVLIVGLYLLFRRLVIPPVLIRYGRVYEEVTGRAIAGATVRLLDRKSGALAEVQMTDRRGRYGFHAGQNIYSLAVEARGYLSSLIVDVTPVEGESVISRDIAMTKNKTKRTPSYLGRFRD